MSGSGLGCVKTPASNLRVEIPSRFRQFENQKCLRPLLGEDNRENNSVHSRLGLVFTQPGLIATEMGRPRYVRSAPDSDQRTDIARGPKGANKRLMHHINDKRLFDHLVGAASSYGGEHYRVQKRNVLSITAIFIAPR
jgi:hypothetical protein